MAGECGAPNPLVHLASHITQDQSLKQEGHITSSFLTRDPLHGQTLLRDGSAEQNFIQEFLAESHSASFAPPSSFHMGALLEEMNEIERPRMELDRDHSSATARIWSEEYHAHNPNLGDVDRSWVRDFENTSGFLKPNNELLWAADYLTASEQPLTDAKDFSDTKWNHDPNLTRIANEIVESTDDPKLAGSEAQLIESIAQSKTESQASAWADEFSSQQSGEKDPDVWQKLQNEWDSMAKDDSGDHPWLSDFESVANSQKEYKFEEDNPLKDHSSPFEEGLKKLQEGDIPTAVLYFEAAAQKDPTHAQAWLFLGKSLAENEQDPEAITALRQCLELEPGNLDALMALAVSYTNESYQEQACYMLKDWVKFNPKYTHLVTSDPPRRPMLGIMSMMSRELYTELMDLYLKAANSTPSEIDPEIQCGLGVLLNLSGSYDKAADCFRAALQVKPDDALLWNRLGATLANDNKSEEAVQAYHHTLALSPGFIRSRYNLGISCLNLGAHREAVEHFLTALNSQASSIRLDGKTKRSLASENIWSTLRMALSLLNRTDLYSAVDNRDLVVLNKEFNLSS